MFGTTAGNVGDKDNFFQGLPGCPHNPWIHSLPTELAENQVSFYGSMSKSKTLDKIAFLKEKKNPKNYQPALAGVPSVV